MADELLWKFLTLNDHNSIHGHGAQARSGGGAMHIALGVDSTRFPVRAFLGVPPGQDTHVVPAVRCLVGRSQASLRLSGRTRGTRRAEWIIQDQRRNRHPAWDQSVGFPTAFVPKDRPIVMLLRVGNDYLAHWVPESGVRALPTSLAKALLAREKGVVPLQRAWTTALRQMAGQSRVAALGAVGATSPAPTFNPSDPTDGRRKILAEVVRRQGQQQFRKALLAAYAGRCAITGTPIEVILEAAHITPYLGPRTNTLANGLLLRADIHTLFDLGLIAVDPTTRRIRVAARLRGTKYEALRGRRLRRPDLAGNRPSRDALKSHFDDSSVE